MDWQLSAKGICCQGLSLFVYHNGTVTIGACSVFTQIIMTCDVCKVAETLMGFNQILNTDFISEEDGQTRAIQKNMAAARINAQQRLEKMSVPEKALLSKMLQVAFEYGGHYHPDDMESMNPQITKKEVYAAAIVELHKIYRPEETPDMAAEKFKADNLDVAALNLETTGIRALNELNYEKNDVGTMFNRIGYVEKDGQVKFNLVDPLFQALFRFIPPFAPDDPELNDGNISGLAASYALSTTTYHQFQFDLAELQEPLTTVYLAHRTLNISAGAMRRNILAMDPN